MKHSTDHPSRRMALLPWCRAVRDNLDGQWPEVDDLKGDLERMWRAGIEPVFAASALAVAEFERSLNA